jgi:hypothetical protein
MSSENTTNEQGARWRKGQSGNPKGRPPGARNRATLAAESLLDGQAEALTRVCIDRALAGDSVALRLCLERILPPRKDRYVRLSIPSIVEAKDVPRTVTAILDAATAGALTPEEGTKLAHLVEQTRKAIETADLEERIKAVEQRMEAKKSA